MAEEKTNSSTCITLTNVTSSYEYPLDIIMEKCLMIADSPFVNGGTIKLDCSDLSLQILDTFIRKEKWINITIENITLKTVDKILKKKLLPEELELLQPLSDVELIDLGNVASFLLYDDLLAKSSLIQAIRIMEVCGGNDIEQLTKHFDKLSKMENEESKE